MLGGEHVGGHHHIVWGIEWSGKKNQYEIHHSLKWWQIDRFTHNNHPKTGGYNEEEYEEEIRRVGGGGGKHGTIVLGVLYIEKR